jgi:hypothetical protein
MITLLTNQQEATRAFRLWADAMLSASTLKDYGWVVEGKGLVFSNYGHGSYGEITDQVMLGVDPQFRTGIVKIVRPGTSRGAKGKLTLVGRDDGGRLLMLREGRLHGNPISRLVEKDFAKLSGLSAEPVSASGVVSDRHWYVVADLDAPFDNIVSQTAAFANACTRARLRAGGGRTRPADTSYGYGMDERGGVSTVKHAGGTSDVVRLQGYVHEQLKKAIGPSLVKPKKDGFCVDGMIGPANLLIEIKTGTSPRNMYEAVGQLDLYPTLIGLPDGLIRMLIVPDDPVIKPSMTAALERADVEVYTYTITAGRAKPKITFPVELIARCKVQVTTITNDNLREG